MFSNQGRRSLVQEVLSYVFVLLVQLGHFGLLQLAPVGALDPTGQDPLGLGNLLLYGPLVRA